jgi:high-affinity iron transporter
MFGAMIIVFREILEAGLIIGIVLAATKNIPRRSRFVSLGIGIGVAGACLVAAFAGFISQLFHGSGQELFNASILFCAVGMLAWHNIWMSSHGRELAENARVLGVEVARGNKKLIAITGVVAIAVLREGSEVVLFLYGLLVGEGWQPILMGGVLGLLLGAASTMLLYFGLLSIPVRYFFSATTMLITLLAAGLAAQGVGFLQQGGYLEVWSTPIWDTSNFLPENGWIGRLFHTLIGYSDHPSGLQALAYVLTFAAIMGLMLLIPQINSKGLNAKILAVLPQKFKN